MPGKLDLDPEPIPDNLQGCRRCGLWKHASQAVPGEGANHARIMLVGEQPGDEEDLRGHPFVGPAGRTLDECLKEATLEVLNGIGHENFVAPAQYEPHCDGRR